MSGGSLSWRSNKQLPTAKTIADSYPIMKTKISQGVIVVRVNDITNKLEAVLVKGRYTYAFNEFVVGNHNKRSIGVVKYLLNNMTVLERCSILSMDFDYMWYHIWLGTNKNMEMYTKQKNRFERRWMEDGGVQLRELVKASKKLPESNLRIEFAKGRKSPSDASELDCAIRETEEETNINPSQYTIIPNIKKRVSFIRMNVKYIYNYFVGFANSNFDVSLDMSNICQIAEISDIRWMDIDQIRQIDKCQRLENIIRPIFKQIKKGIHTGQIGSKCQSHARFPLKKSRNMPHQMIYGW